MMYIPQVPAACRRNCGALCCLTESLRNVNTFVVSKIIMLLLLFLGDLRKASQLLLVNGLLRANQVLSQILKVNSLSLMSMLRHCYVIAMYHVLYNAATNSRRLHRLIICMATTFTIIYSIFHPLLTLSFENSRKLFPSLFVVLTYTFLCLQPNMETLSHVM